MSDNGDTLRNFSVGDETLRGLGSFHKTLPHNQYGEVDSTAFANLVAATAGDGSGFGEVPKGRSDAAELTNPQAGLAADQLTRHPASYSMPPAPTVLSDTTAAEMTELYWMALLRDLPFNQMEADPCVTQAAAEIDEVFGMADGGTDDFERLRAGIDVPGAAGQRATISPRNIFRLGLPGEERGPMISQFLLRPVAFGTQSIDQQQRPYKTGLDYLTDFPNWLDAQCSGRDSNGLTYSHSNEAGPQNFEHCNRYISTMRDMARFVNKDALHQAYFSASLLLLSGGAKWTPGNPYGQSGRFSAREAGFGVLGGPHILALVSEVATRALKVVWNQKWQVHLRLRPEAYGGLAHVQNIGVDGVQRPYGLPDWLTQTAAACAVSGAHGSYLLPLAFTAGSPTHPAYGAGHATVAGACVTVLKAYFKTFETTCGADRLVPFSTLVERDVPFGVGAPIKSYISGYDGTEWQRFELDAAVAQSLTIEGELNKLAQNVAMGRSMGGVHWRTDNTRSLLLGEALAAGILADITTDVNENPVFEFRTFSRKADGQPKKVRIEQGRVHVDGVLVDSNASAI